MSVLSVMKSKLLNLPDTRSFYILNHEKGQKQFIWEFLVESNTGGHF